MLLNLLGGLAQEKQKHYAAGDKGEKADYAVEDREARC
jgi:hypothetical protein